MFSYPDPQNPSVLEYQIELEADPDSIAIDILLHNEIPGIVPISKRQVDGLIRLKYDAGNAIPGSLFLQRAVTDAEVVGFLKSITEGLLNAQRFMLDGNNYVLDPNSVYFNPAEKSAALIYLPIKGQQVQDVAIFLDSLVQHFQSEPGSSHMLRLQIRDHIRQSEKLDLRGLLKYLLTLEVSLQIPRQVSSTMQPSATPPSGATQPFVQPLAQAPGVQYPLDPAHHSHHALGNASQALPHPSTAPPQQGQPFPPSASPQHGAPPLPLQTQANRSANRLTHGGFAGATTPHPTASVASHGAGQLPPTATIVDRGSQPSGEAPAPLPGKKPKAPKVKKKKSSSGRASDSGEKPMSLLYLMAHYSSENKKKYDEQRAAAKADAEASRGGTPQISPPLSQGPQHHIGPSKPSGPELAGNPPRSLSSATPNGSNSAPIIGAPSSALPGGVAAPLQSGESHGLGAEPHHYLLASEPVTEEDFGHTVLFGQQNAPAMLAPEVPTPFGSPVVTTPHSQAANVGEPGEAGLRSEYQPAPSPLPPQPAVQSDSFALPIDVSPEQARASLTDAASGQGPRNYAVIKRVSTGEVFPVDRDEFVIGRTSQDADLNLADRTVSKRHATIYRDASGWSIQDRGATNGVILDGVQVSPGSRVPLATGATISLGDEELRFEVR